MYKGVILEPCFNKLLAVPLLRQSFRGPEGLLGVFGGEEVLVRWGGVCCSSVILVRFLLFLRSERLIDAVFGGAGFIGDGVFGEKVRFFGGELL